MVKIKQLRYQNYCGYRDTIFDFTDDDGSVKPLAAFFGPNGTGKSTCLNGVRLVSNASRYENRDTDLSFRKITYHEDYDPTYSALKMEYGLQNANPMEIEALFETSSGDKRVLIDNHGVQVNELPRNPAGHCYLIDADHPMEKNKFQLVNSDYADTFLEIAKVVYDYDCYFDKSVSDNGHEFFTDFVIVKYGTKVHFKSMSDGEKKIATLLAGLCNPEYMDQHKIILVDNIEMHIYFKRHAKMMDLLLEKFPDKQFIVTTHSGVLIEHIPQKYHYDLELYKSYERYVLDLQKSATEKPNDEVQNPDNVDQGPSEVLQVSEVGV